MSELIYVSQFNGVEVVDSQTVAIELDIQHKNLLETIEKYKPTIEKEFGLLAFETKVREQRTGFGIRQNEEQIYYLTEDQAIFIGSLSRNSESVVRFKVKLVKSFQAARRALSQVVQISREQKIAEALMLTQEIIAEKDAEIKQLKPKAEYTDKVLQSDSTMTVTEVAKSLGMSATSLNKILCDRGIQYKHRGHYVLYSKYQNKGYTKLKTVVRLDTDGVERAYMQLEWTEYGRAFINQQLNPTLSFYRPVVTA